ncbi:hypothetical protein KPL47_24685 [Clostridium estertheticum]|uniref:hypothetical protein n=1 Tax=Clostridium estertheticum TaxID=238834 RepID=UPI001C0C2DA9|nr:hypothetical protein [Clostridium estertheticum]MBU3179470.1 hypothetical protein [Clostridium estertheticum]MBX4262810.1 hypothetical protein [Clostridium estertheticum]WLC72245.1 hypothetical protein KTC96_09810 [Clostridium estertheticum]
MNDIFIKSIYQTIVEENREIYRQLFNETIVDKRTTEYWKQALSLYNNLSNENEEVMINIIEQTMIDTISNMLGIIDGSSTLKNCNIEPKLLLDNNDTDGELQDLFLEYVEDRGK